MALPGGVHAKKAVTGHHSALAVSLELGDVSLVSMPLEGLQPSPGRGSRDQLLVQLQELLNHWALWSAVKSRWVVVGESSTPCSPARAPRSPLQK